MTRKHRAAHRLIWPALAVVVGVLFVMALAMRPPPAASAPHAPVTGARA